MEVLRKTKLYLDTSVLSYLKQEDSAEKMQITNQFWEEIKKRDDIEIFVSGTTIREMNDCFEPKRTFMFQKLAELTFIKIDSSEKIEILASEIVKLGILTEKSHDDCLHIAAAVMNDCDYIASWNFKHLVNVKTINGVRAITNLQGFKQIDIISPEMFIQGGENG